MVSDENLKSHWKQETQAADDWITGHWNRINQSLYWRIENTYQKEGTGLSHSYNIEKSKVQITVLWKYRRLQFEHLVFLLAMQQYCTEHDDLNLFCYLNIESQNIFPVGEHQQPRYYCLSVHRIWKIDSQGQNIDDSYIT